jgi:integrase
MARLTQRDELPARALEFLILTATRSGEVRGARWDEIVADMWIIPGERTKTGRPHRVPLSGRAVALLASLPRSSEYVFAQTGKQLATNTLTRLLRRMGVTAVPHGFRSTFRDWAAETTAYPNYVVEMALAHAIKSGVEEAYRRGDLFEKRRRLMDDWARYCNGANVRSGEVVTLRAS